MTKRILAFLMCGLMIFSSVPFSPLAELFDFALTAEAADEGLKVTVPKITVFEKSEGKLAPVTTYNGNVIESGVTYSWSSSDTTIATVSADGTVKGIAPGEVDITVVASYLGMNVTLIRTIEIVRFREVDNLEADGSASVSILEKEQKKLQVRVLPTSATTKELKWTTSNAGVVKVVSSGVDEDNSKAYANIEGVKAGTATLTYTTTDGTDKSGTFTVTVKPQITALSLPPFVIITTSSTGYTVNYKITPSNAGNQTLEWASANSAVCSVDALGVIKPGTSKQPGTCFVTARTKDGSNITAKTYVVVSDGTKSLTLDKSSLTMKVGDSDIDLKATGVLSNDVEYEDAVNWSSSNTSVATVDALGIVKAVGPGTAKITATVADGSTDGNGKTLTATCSVSVTQPLKGVSLPENQVCWVGGTVLLTPQFNPSNASNKNVTWTSLDEDIATVSSTGLVTGKKEGVTTVTVKTAEGGFIAYCRVSVEIPPESISLSDTSKTLKAGSSYTLKATVKPDSATNKSVSWSSSDTSVATVDQNGKVTAVAGGMAVITCTAKSGGVKATCRINVSEDATSITIINAPKELFVTKTYILQTKYNSTTVTNHNITWSSSNPGVLGVDQNGMLTARSKGSSVIKATYTRSDGTKLTAECTVFVKDKIEVTGVKLNKSKQTIYTGINSNVNLYAVVSPSDASDQSISWSTSNKAAADVLDGTVVAKKPGTAKITVTTADGGKTDYCTVIVIGPVDFEKSSAKIAIGSSEVLSLRTENPSGTKITWKSSNSDVATVDGNGLVTGKKAGTVTVTATTPGGLYSASCKVTVVTPVTGVKINADTLTIPKAEKRTVTATVYPSNASDKKVTWSAASSGSLTVIEISATGQIEAKRVGTATVTVTTNDGKYTDTITVNVIQPVTSLAFDYSSITLDAGKKKTLSPAVRPTNATDKTVKWSSSNKKVATVSSKGVVTAVAAGTATITCSSADGYAKETVKVTVTQPPTGIKFKSKKTTVKIGTPKKLTVTVLPETASNKNVIWSSADEKIAKVAADGTVTGLKKGTVKIKATTANSLYSATITVKVEKPVKKVTLNKTSITIAVGKTTTITATVSPKSASNKQVKWKSSDNDVVTVKDGKITAKAPGYAVITCTSADSGKKAECTVFVNQPVKSVKLNKTKLIMDIDDKITLKATVKPSDASNKAVKWTSSNKKVVKVTSKGVLKPVSTGTATITVTTKDGGFKKTCKVTVVKRVKSVSLPKSLTVYLGEKAQLDAVLTPKKPSNPDVKWKSGKKSVATVSKNGLVTAKKTGTANITVTTEDGGLTATCKVSVKRKLKSFTLNKKKATLDVGKKLTLKVTRKPSNATEGITFTSSNKKVATVSSKGVITAKGKGTATITAKSERGITVKCKITVKQPVTSMQISKTSASVYMGESFTLTANVLPANANNQSFTWISSDTSVVTVSGGTVTPKKVGTATVTAKSANGKTASCTVTVKQHVTGITLDKKTVSLEQGKTAALKVTVNPANATEKGYSFTSSNTAIATVSAAGVITAKAPGKATVTVRSKENNKTATCAVTVIQRVTGIEISTTAETLYVDKYSVGETLQLKATVSPSNATDKTVKWSSSDSAVASVSSSGLVTAKKSGVALITVTTNDGKKTAKCAVTVLQNVTGIKLEQTEITVNSQGEPVRLIATAEPADAFNKNIVWTYENEEIATVDKYGWLQGVSVGKTTVYATTVDGEFRASCLVTVNEPVTGVSLDITEVPSLYRGESVTLTPTVYPDFIEEYINKDVLWSSSDESIAKVENGVVTATGAGEAVITVTTADGGFTAECKVTCFIPVEEIRTAEEIYYIKIGAQQKIGAIVLPENASFPEVTWKILSGADYFTCEDGVITGTAKGNGLLQITSDDNPEVTKTVEIRIVRSVENVTLDKADVTLNKGETSKLTATVAPSDAHNKKVSFSSSDEGVVTVSADGTLTAVGKGTARVTVTTEDEGRTAECLFTVKQLAEEIVFPEDEYTVAIGENKKINLLPAVLPENTDDKTLEWVSSDSSVATVANGTVTGIKQGEALITATATDSGKISASVRVTVVQHAESISLAADRDTLWVGESIELIALVLPVDTTDRTVTYISCDESIAAVDEKGVVTVLSGGETGTATVTVKAVSACGSAESEYTFTVKQQITDITVPEETVVMKLGETYCFEPTVLPENAFDKTVSYASSDEEVITVENGTVTTVGTGTATVTLTSACGKVEKQCSVKVIVLPDGIDMEKEISVEKTKTRQLNAVLSPDNVTETKITWSSSDEKVATVDEKGLVTALKAGTAVIRAQSEAEDIFAECTVTVYVNSEKIELTAEKHELYVGEEFTLGATVLPEDTTDKRVTFASSDDDIVTVDSEGRVRATGKGTATVTVTAVDTGITSVCEVTVRKHVESISLPEDAVAYAGRSLKLEADILPADADNKKVSWSVSDTRVASISADGVLTAHEKGFVLVTAETEDGGFKAVCFVEILIGIESVSLDKKSLLLDRGATARLSFSVLPANADEKKVIWSTSDSEIATVDSRGNVTATQKSGTAVIRATAADNPEAWAECEVTVKTPLETIFLQENEIKLRKNQTKVLAVVFRPENATVKDVTYESADSEIASVDEKGLITAHKPGEVSITVTSVEGGYTTVCRVKVIREIESFASLPLVVSRGSQAACRVIAEPYDHDEELIFSCENEDIATVDNDGLVTAKAPGNTVITVKGSISGVSHSIPLTVKEPVTGVNFEREEASVVKNGYILVGYSILPADANNVESVVITSSDSAVAKIVYGSDGTTDGTVQGLQTGRAEITVTVTTNDGTFTDTYILTVTEPEAE